MQHLEERLKTLASLQLLIQNIHVRYEDDLFTHGKPFSVGAIVSELRIDSGEEEWRFDGPGGLRFTRVAPDRNVFTMKNILARDVRLYWNSMSEMYVPTSLWESTRHLEF